MKTIPKKNLMKRRERSCEVMYQDARTFNQPPTRMFFGTYAALQYLIRAGKSDGVWRGPYNRSSSVSFDPT